MTRYLIKPQDWADAGRRELMDQFRKSATIFVKSGVLAVNGIEYSTRWRNDKVVSVPSQWIRKDPMEIRVVSDHEDLGVRTTQDGCGHAVISVIR
jgi:hypothetical protein